jgi:ParB family chromosome partitioning protein
VRASIRSGELSAGHARALIGQADPERLVREILARGLNVRQVEELARAQAKPGAGAGRRPPQKLADTIALEKQMSDALGLVVTIDYRANGGAVHIKYRTLDQLRDVIRRLERAP